MRRILVLCVGCIAFIVVAVWLAWAPLAERAVQSALKSVAAKKNNVGWKGLKVQGTTLSIDSVEGWLPLKLRKIPLPIPVSFELSKVRASVPFLSIMTGSPSVTFSLSAYRGSIEGEARQITSTPTVDIVAKELGLADHPTIQGLGIRSGVVTASLHELALSDSGPMSGHFDLELKELSTPELPSTLTIIQIPALEQIHAKATGNLETSGELQTIRVEKFSLLSSLLTAEGSAKIVVPRGSNRGTCEGEVQVALSDHGAAVLGSAVTLGSALTNTPMEKDAKRFRIRVTGSTASQGCALPQVYANPYCLTIKFMEAE